MRSATLSLTLHRFNHCTACGLSDPGRVRRVNEDHFLIDPALGLIVIADGMGGHTDGALASETALQRIAATVGAACAATPRASAGPVTAGDPDATVHDDALDAIRTLLDALDQANATLYALNTREPGALERGMGTTVTGLWQPAASDLLVAFQVGDSRLYRYRDGALLQLSRDQTLYQQALDLGNIDHLPPRNVLLQALGPLPAVAPVVETHPCAPGDRYLLCSDGLYGEVPHHEIEAVLAAVSVDTLEAACQRLVELTLDAGGKDNVTAVVACYDNAAAGGI
ncbi:protein phosphatase 2C domain-containing protein [Paraburkholderia sediminicola]|uniref:Protein phosphatase 2C domain-containing protein n=1 Tax=Paraburkholderia rhynchosiae TaxID=487049 RepID=A0ACC7N7C3_9BURK